MIQSYDIQIPAGGTQLLEVGAQIFDFLSSGSAFDQIQVLPEFQQGNVTLKLGQGFDAGQIVNRWFVKNPGATAINGTVVLSTAGFRNFRISGDVNVLDGGKSRTLSGVAFMGGGGMSGLASNYQYSQLWNPPANTKRFVVEQVTATAANAGSVWLRGSNTALTTNNGNLFMSKLVGGAVSSGEQHTQSSTSVLGFGQYTAKFLPVNGQVDLILHEPIIVLPGEGLMVQSALGNDIAAYFEFFEEANT
ncbi:hypothetical protein [Burkholderia vietnamiensis]|uniref:hypothetical protein n=1 Tax=Burkholderia vietnamiensis TaxID=60552 RepID=UPI00075A1CEE|nr:hypothetical protein [Burkholderia vietnamiensis]KVR79131.1 hypothetical protein WK26_18220 [Burkholderia vietnamiensis]KVS29260.1 hypothetical protein WK35_13485 [Burkholderia vietnamiensis]